MRKKNCGFFSIIDVIAVLTEQTDFQKGRKYWNKLKERLKKEGNETVTNCHQLKMKATDGKMRITDIADTEQLLRLIQSIPSPKAEPFKPPAERNLQFRFSNKINQTNINIQFFAR